MALNLVKNKDNIFDADSITKGLNPEQTQAVECIIGPLLIVAGAGSGKTKVLTHRIANLIYNGVKPWTILALTFTNKAAGEMKQRIAKILGAEQADKVWAGTFHSTFAKILRFEANFLGYTSSFSIYDSDDSLSLIKAIIKDLNYDPKDIKPQDARSKISWSKNQMINVMEFHRSAVTYQEKCIAKIFEEYNKRLFANNSMDFDDLLLNMIHLFHNQPDVLKKYQNKFQYILVDEYQDTNRAQYIIINELAKAHHNLCVVGDDAQSIYKWRGADIRNILDFKIDYPKTNVIRLEQNYRSTQTIISAADSVIKKNRSQIPKTLWTENPEGDKIDLFEFDSDIEEADKIAERINEGLSSKDFIENDFALLYRTNAQSLSLENALRRKKIKYMVVGGVSFYARKEIKDVLSYLKILVNPQDNEALLRSVNEPPRGIGNTTIKHIQNFAAMQRISLFEAFCRAEEIEELQKRAVIAVKNFSEFILAHKYILTSDTTVLHVSNYIEKTNIINMYKEMDTDDAKDRLNNINQLFIDLEQFFYTIEDATLEDYLQQSTLITDLDKKDLHQNSVKLMTLHASKGLEFPYVFIAGMEQGLFPLGNAINNHEEMEEERRLFYVGITRAERKLMLSHCKRRMKFGEIQEQCKSALLLDVDKTFLNEINRRPQRREITKKDNPFLPKQQMPRAQPQPKKEFYFDDIPAQETYSQLPNNTVAKQPLYLNLKVGDTIRHSLFGVGKIDALSGIADNKQAEISFPSVGKKKILIKFAKMEKIKL